MTKILDNMAQARKKKSEKSSIFNAKFNYLTREVVLFVCSAIALYMFLSLVTYSPHDPGWSHSGNPERISNLGGYFGARFADLAWLIFGHMVYLLPLMIGVWGWRYFRQRGGEPQPLQRRILTGIGFLLILLGGCGLENIQVSPGAESAFTPGGILGATLVQYVLIPTVGSVGSTLVLLTMFVTGSTWFTGLSWFRLMDLIGKNVFEFYDYLRTNITTFTDRVVGVKARQQRQEKVTKIQKRQVKKAPTRIEPLIKTPIDSGRLEREKQAELFENLSVTSPLPGLSLLNSPEVKKAGFSQQALETMSRLLEKKLNDFNIMADVVEVLPGPVITRFEIEPSPGTKSSQLTSVSRDLARALSVVSVRVVENIPGKTVIGIEIPNEIREIVSLVEGLSSRSYEDANTPLALMLGKDISGAPVVVDLCKMPHILIAGTTGSGKSVCINALILSILYKSSPEEVRLIMIDPKMLELSVYEGIPHLLAPVVTDMQKASNALRWCIVEMERRYRLMSALGVRNIAGYNRKIKAADDSGKPILDPLAESDEEREALISLAYIVVIIDELADLMMVVGKKVEELITRIAQRARAAGIHLVLATQRPSVDVITGLLKANIPSRIAFQVSSRVDSRTVLDQMGAEQLLGHGDMLYLPPGSSVPQRVHGAFVDDQEVHRVVAHLRQSGQPQYDDNVTEGLTLTGGSGESDADGNGGESDPLYDQALRLVTETRRASISAVQRHLRVGYNRAARMIEAMEVAGAVGTLQSNGKREVLAPPPPES
ncbi:DNA translocase FtsK [Pseudomonadota bacterium]